ncbi:MAG: hypothetical protein H7839_06340 [Magnetococcus sp. YQC-5]
MALAPGRALNGSLMLFYWNDGTKVHAIVLAFDAILDRQAQWRNETPFGLLTGR